MNIWGLKKRIVTLRRKIKTIEGNKVENYILIQNLEKRISSAKRQIKLLRIKRKKGKR